MKGDDVVSLLHNSKFRDEIIDDLGEVVFSNTQKIRVLRVKEEITGLSKISIQKWWRASDTSPWIAGKGFKVDINQAKQLANILSKVR